MIDSDNGLGGGRRSVDDGFAIAALLLGGAPVAGLASVFGNASEAEADSNNRALAALCGFGGRLLRGASRPGESTEASRFLSSRTEPVRIAALGPLTNIAAALRESSRVESVIKEMVVVGGNRLSRGRWPPWWPYEFNLTADRAAARELFESPIPWTIVPINVLDRLSVSGAELAQLRGSVGEYLRQHSERCLAKRGRFRLGDLIAALYVLGSDGIRVDRVRARMHRNAWIDFSGGEKEVHLVREVDGTRLWLRFVEIINAAR